MKFRNSFDLKLNVVRTDLYILYYKIFRICSFCIFRLVREMCGVKMGMRILVVGDTKRLSCKDKPRLQGK